MPSITTFWVRPVKKDLVYVVNDALSGWYHVKSGVLQGSVLSLLLFLIYINNR